MPRSRPDLNPDAVNLDHIVPIIECFRRGWDIHEAAALLGTFITSLAEVQRQSGVTFPVPKGVVYTDTGWARDMKSNRAAKAKVCALPSK